MNWDALGAIGELVGAAAVVLTPALAAVAHPKFNPPSPIAVQLKTTKKMVKILTFS